MDKHVALIKTAPPIFMFINYIYRKRNILKPEAGINSSCINRTVTLQYKLAFLAILFIILPYTLKGQLDSTYYTNENSVVQLDELRAQYGNHKTMPAAYELSILVALSHYPELINTSIDFIESPIHSTMAARPRSQGLLEGRDRSYIVYINNCKENTGFLPSELSFNQLTGVMGHELAHVCYYTGRTAFDLFLDGMGYYLKDYRKSLEAGTDMITIDHGLGWQLLDFCEYILNSKNLSLAYEKKRRTTYLGSQDLLLALKKREATFPR